MTQLQQVSSVVQYLTYTFMDLQETHLSVPPKADPLTSVQMQIWKQSCDPASVLLSHGLGQFFLLRDPAGDTPIQASGSRPTDLDLIADHGWEAQLKRPCGLAQASFTLSRSSLVCPGIQWETYPSVPLEEAPMNSVHLWIHSSPLKHLQSPSYVEPGWSCLPRNPAESTSIHTPRVRSVELDPGCRPKQPCDLVLAFLSHGPGPAPPVQVPSQ